MARGVRSKRIRPSGTFMRCRKAFMAGGRRWKSPGNQYSCAGHYLHLPGQTQHTGRLPGCEHVVSVDNHAYGRRGGVAGQGGKLYHVLLLPCYLGAMLTVLRSSLFESFSLPSLPNSSGTTQHADHQVCRGRRWCRRKGEQAVHATFSERK